MKSVWEKIAELILAAIALFINSRPKTKKKDNPDDENYLDDLNRFSDDGDGGGG